MKILRTALIALTVGASALTWSAIAQDGGPPVTAIEPATPGPATPLPSKLGLTYQVNHVALRVANLQESVAWWKNVMGAVEVRRTDMSAMNEGAEIVFMHISGNFHIELVGNGEITTPPGLPPEDIAADYRLAGWKHIGFYVSDYDGLKEHMQEQGVEVMSENTVTPYGVRLFLVKDPSGYFIEFYAPLEGNEEKG